MQIDIAFGDAITPASETLEYPSLLEMPAARSDHIFAVDQSVPRVKHMEKNKNDKVLLQKRNWKLLKNKKLVGIQVVTSWHVFCCFKREVRKAGFITCMEEKIS